MSSEYGSNPDESGKIIDSASKTIGDIYRNRFTPRDREILWLSVLYWGDEKKVGERLGIKRATVRKHLRKICGYVQANYDDFIQETNEKIEQQKKIPQDDEEMIYAS